MNRLTILFLIIISALISCNKLDIVKGTPKCVENKIKDFNKSSTCDNADVKEYTFQEKTVYVFNPGNCGADMASEVINSECNSLGFLGGFSGNVMINGEDFSNATFVQTTWKK